MELNALELEGFRNYKKERFTFDSGVSVIVGENAQGKTNLLEAVVCLTGGKSPRARSDRELIGFDEDAARITGDVTGRGRAFRIELTLSRERRRRAEVNRVPVKTAAELSGTLLAVLFRPEDLGLVREGAAVRRKFLDTALCQLRPRYAAALSAYRRAWEQKSRILKDAGEYPGLLDTLPEFSEQMVRSGAAVIRYRARFTRQLRRIAAQGHRECSGDRETLTVRYQTISTLPDIDTPDRDNEAADAVPAEEEIAAALREHMDAHREAELRSKQCLSGPHRDDLAVEINGQDARAYASQGQARTAALAMKMAERELYRNAAGEYPLLLLDDVLSELDPRRQEFVLNRIGQGQVFITCCEEDRLTDLPGGKVLRIHNGRWMK